MEQIFKCDIYNKSREWQAPLGAFVKVEGTKRFDNVSDFDITVKANHNRLGQLLQPGTRLKLRLRDETFIEGPIVAHAGEGPGVSGTFTFSVEDNFRILRNFLIYQKPGESMANQVLAYSYEQTGDAETVFKDIVRLNIGNRGVEPVIIAPNLNRGGTITASARMATIYNEMFPLLESLGLGASVSATPNGLVVDVYVPGTYPNKLTESSRVIRKWKYQLKAPDVTHVVVGGQGEGVDRRFIDANDSVREALWGDRIEVFRDARDAALIDTYYERATETLFDGRGSAALVVNLAETANFKLGGPKGLKVGQRVTAKVAQGLVEVTDILREVDFSWSTDSGLDIKGQIGQAVEPTAQIVSTISQLAGSVSKLKASL